MESVDIKTLEGIVKANEMAAEKSRRELERMREKEEYGIYAQKLHDLYQSLVDQGFTEEQAFYIFYEAVKLAWGNV